MVKNLRRQKNTFIMKKQTCAIVARGAMKQNAKQNQKQKLKVNDEEEIKAIKSQLKETFSEVRREKLFHKIIKNIKI